MRKKKFYKKHKIAIILGLLATANLSIIGFATFVVPAKEPTVSVLPDIQVQVGDVTSENQSVTFTIDSFTSFTVHTDGFYDETTKTLSNVAKFSIATTFTSTLTIETNFEISLTNSITNSNYDFFGQLSATKFIVGSYEKKSPTSYENKTLTYSDVPASKLGVKDVGSGSLTFTFEFTVSTDNYTAFYNNVFKNIYEKDLTFTLSIKNI